MAARGQRRGAALLAVGLLACLAAARPALASSAVPAAEAFGAFLSGRFAAEEMDTGAAADNLLLALRTDPDRRELLEPAFLAALLDGRADALRLARRLPGNATAELVLLGAEISAGRFARARGRARSLGRQGAMAVLQPVLVAWSSAGAGEPREALAPLRRLVEARRFRALNALHAALIADSAGARQEAVRFARLALADQPEPTLRLALLAASILHRHGRPGEGIRLLDRLADNHDELALAALGPARERVLAARGIAGPAEGIAEAYVALGAALRGQDLEEMSAVLARLALRLRPGFPPALLLLGDILSEAGQPDAALRTLDAIPADDPLAAPAALRRAGLLDGLDRLPEAEALLRAVAEAHPRQPQPHVRLGDIHRRRERFADAAAAYDAAIERVGKPGAADWPLFYARGVSRERSGEWPGAEEDFLRALALAPEQPLVLNYLGYSWADKGLHLDRARAMLLRAVELRPQDGNIADSLGWALFRLGDVDGAIHWLERAVELEPRSGTINDHLGDALWAAGREHEARFQWLRALGMEPEPAEAEGLARKLRDGLPRRD